MIESFYDFEKSIEHKMDILEREGKTTWIGEYIDKFGNPKKDKKPVICKYDEHDMMVRLPSLWMWESHGRSSLRSWKCMIFPFHPFLLCF